MHVSSNKSCLTGKPRKGRKVGEWDILGDDEPSTEISQRTLVPPSTWLTVSCRIELDSGDWTYTTVLAYFGNA